MTFLFFQARFQSQNSPRYIKFHPAYACLSPSEGRNSHKIAKHYFLELVCIEDVNRNRNIAYL
jgi:hypothetical protein